MRALSVRQPWAWALLHGGKDVENRTWTTAYRGILVVHAGKTGDGWEAIETVHELTGQWPLDVRGAFLGTVELWDVHAAAECEHICPEPGDDWQEQWFPCELHDGPCNNVCSEWAMPGQYHWMVRNPRMFPGVVGNGRLGLFEPPPEVASAASQPLAHSSGGVS